MSDLRTLPLGWTECRLPDLVGPEGLLTDGDWVESKDQDPSGEVRLIQLADIGDGKFSFRSNRFMRVARAEEMRCTTLLRDDVLIARMPDPLGRACLFPGYSKTCVTVVDVCILRIDHEGIDRRWLMHFVNSPAFRAAMEQQRSGTTRARISKTNLASLVLPIPPASEQSRIATVVDAVFEPLEDGISELKAASRKLAGYRQSLLKAAVEGALTAEWRARNPPQETGAELLARILRERRARWEVRQLARFKAQGKAAPKGWQSKYGDRGAPDTSQLPLLPAGWVYASIGQCFEVSVGATPSRKVADYWGGDVPWVSSGEVRFNHISKTREAITEQGLANSSTQINPAGSVLLGMIGEGKTRGQVAILDIDAANNQNCAAIWVPETDVPPEFIYCWLWSRYDETRRGSSGNNQPALNKSLVEAMPMPLAPVAEMREVVEQLSAQLSGIEAQEREIGHLLRLAAAQRQNILRAAFTGQLVPQDPADEPASALLARIRAERAQRPAAAKRMRRSPPQPATP